MHFYRFRLAVFYPACLYSHRDEARIVERALRRAGILPVYTGGFSPHPRMSFGPARPTGYFSLCDYVDVQLRDAIDIKKLNRCLPDGIEVLEAVEIGESDFGNINRQIKGALQALLVRKELPDIDELLAQLPDTKIYSDESLEASIFKFISDKMPSGELTGGLSCYCFQTWLTEKSNIPRLDRILFNKYSEEELTALNPVFLRVCFIVEASDSGVCNRRGSRKDTYFDR